MIACLAECATIAGHANSLDRFTGDAILLDAGLRDLGQATACVADAGLGGGMTCDLSAYALVLYWKRSPRPDRYGLYARATICSTERSLDFGEPPVRDEPLVGAQLTYGAYLVVGHRARLFTESQVNLLRPSARFRLGPITLAFSYSIAVTASLRLTAQIHTQLSLPGDSWPAAVAVGGGYRVVLPRRSDRLSVLRREKALDQLRLQLLVQRDQRLDRLRRRLDQQP